MAKRKRPKRESKEKNPLLAWSEEFARDPFKFIRQAERAQQHHLKRKKVFEERLERQIAFAAKMLDRPPKIKQLVQTANLELQKAKPNLAKIKEAEAALQEEIRDLNQAQKITEKVIRTGKKLRIPQEDLERLKVPLKQGLALEMQRLMQISLKKKQKGIE